MLGDSSHSTVLLASGGALTPAMALIVVESLFYPNRFYIRVAWQIVRGSRAQLGN